MVQHKPQIFSFTPKEDLSGRFLYNSSEKDIENPSNKSIIEKEREEEEDKDGNITEGNYYHMIITTASVLCAVLPFQLRLIKFFLIILFVFHLVLTTSFYSSLHFSLKSI